MAGQAPRPFAARMHVALVVLMLVSFVLIAQQRVQGPLPGRLRPAGRLGLRADRLRQRRPHGGLREVDEAAGPRPADHRGRVRDRCSSSRQSWSTWGGSRGDCHRAFRGHEDRTGKSRCCSGLSLTVEAGTFLVVLRAAGLREVGPAAAADRAREAWPGTDPAAGDATSPSRDPRSATSATCRNPSPSTRTTASTTTLPTR